MKFKIFASKLLLVFLCAPLLLKFANCYELQQAIEDALSKNSRVEAARSNSKMAQAQYKASGAGFLPSITGYVSSNVATTSYTESAITQSRLDEPALGIVFKQNIFNYGADLSNLRKSYSDYLAQAASSNYEIEQVVIDVVSAYLKLLKAQKTKNLYQDTLQVAKNNFTAEQKKFSVGESSKSDVAKVKASLSSVYASYIKSQGDEQNAIVKFSNLIAKTEIDLNFPTSLPNLPNSLEEAIALAARFNSKLNASLQQKRSVEFNKAAVIANSLPSIDLTVNFAGISSVKGIQQSITVQANIPIFSKGQEYSAISSASYAVNKYKALHKNAYKALEEELTTAWNDHQNSIFLIDAAEDAVNAYKISVESIREEAKVNLKTMNDVTEAETKLLEAKKSLLEAKINKVISVYRLNAIIYGSSSFLKAFAN